MTPQEQAANAIKAIDALPSYKQAPMGERNIMGSQSKGYCCLGAMATSLQIPFGTTEAHSVTLAHVIGLIDLEGFLGGKAFFRQVSLTAINDDTNAGFKRIQRFMQTKPHWMFKPEVAEIIKEHYLAKVN